MTRTSAGSARLWAFMAIIGANIIWGINYVLSKRVVPVSIDPSTLTMYRVLVAAALFWVVSLLYKREKVARQDLIRMFFAALFGVAINQFLFISGIAKTTPVDASIIMTSNPIIVLLLSAAVLGDRITPSKIVGIVIGAAGAISLIAYSGTISFGSGTLTGNLLILGNSTAYAFYLVAVKPVMAKYSSITVMKWVFLFGMIQVLPIGLGPMLSYPILNQPIQVLGDIAFIVIGATFLAYLLTSQALSHIKATTISIFAYTQPVIAGIFSVMLGFDEINAMKIASMVLVFIGVYIASRNSLSLPLVKSSKK